MPVGSKPEEKSIKYFTRLANNIENPRWGFAHLPYIRCYYNFKGLIRNRGYAYLSNGY